MITVYIHSGTGKTGTSAIQAFLNYNRENLFRDFSCLYPNFNISQMEKGKDCHNHCKFVLNDKDFNQKLEKAIDLCREQNISKIIISCEGIFANPAAGEKIFSHFQDKSDVSFRIIVFFRRQDHFLESSWKQWGSKDKRFRTIDEYIAVSTIRWLDQLTEFGKIFGKENLIARPYEKEQLKEGLISEFLKLCDIPFAGYRWITPPDTNANINVGFDRDVIEILSLNKAFLKDIHDNTLMDFFYRNLPETYLKKPYEQYDFLSPVQRIRILERYDQMNQTIAREYLGRENGQLFVEPRPEPDDAWNCYEGLTVEKIVPIFTQMLLNIDKENRRLRNVKKPGLRQRVILKLKKWGIIPRLKKWGII
jgi:hypothetical protein